MLTFVFFLTCAIRIFLFISPSINLTECPELVTPLSSMHRVREGISLARSGSSPYEGNLFHQPPLVIAFLFPFFDDKGSTPRYDGMPLQILFFIADVLVAYMLRSIMSRKLVRDGYGNGNTKRTLLEPTTNQYYVPNFLRDATLLPDICAAAYMLHPFALGSSSAWDISSLVRVFTVGSIYFASTSKPFLSCFCLAFSSYVEIHPIIYVVATAALEMAELQNSPRKSNGNNSSNNNSINNSKNNSKNNDKTVNISKKKELKQYVFVLLRQFITIVLIVLMLHVFTWYFWNAAFKAPFDVQHVFQSTYVWNLTAQDYTPNVGIYWYFFSMLFDRFKPYFTFAFNVQLFVYVLPLVIRIRGRPLVLVTVLTSLVALLRPYPTLGDFAVPSVFMLMHPHLIARMRNKSTLIVITMIGVVLMPTMWYLWLYPGAVCANHYFFSQLTYTLSLLLTVSEFLGAAVLRDRQITETIENVEKQKVV